MSDDFQPAIVIEGKPYQPDQAYDFAEAFHNEGRHDEHAVARINRRRQRLHVRGRIDDLQPIAQPLHRRARDEDAPFERVLQTPVEARGDGLSLPAVYQPSERA